MKNQFLVGKKIYLRGLVESDLVGDYFQWFNDEEVCRENSHHRFPNTVARMKSYFDSVTNSSQNLVLAILLKADDKHIGNISLQQIDLLNQSAELAILIGDKKSWGKGYGIEAARLIVEHGFMQLNLKRIHCGTTASNRGMQKLALSLGMKQEGKFRSAVFKNGAFQDVYYYGLLANEVKNKLGK